MATINVPNVGEVTIEDTTGDLVAVQSGGPAGAWHIEDDNGPVNVALKSEPASAGSASRGTVWASRAKADVDAVVAAFNA
jgi:hypothetical protein